jgi:hypothetical protein
MGISTRITVVGMVSSGSASLIQRAGMLDVVGGLSAAPALISDFGAGRI